MCYQRTGNSGMNKSCCASVQHVCVSSVHLALRRDLSEQRGWSHAHSTLGLSMESEQVDVASGARVSLCVMLPPRKGAACVHVLWCDERFLLK